MELHYRVAGHIPVERAIRRWETDVIEIDAAAPVTVVCIQTQKVLRITGPATLAADIDALGRDCIQIAQMRMLWYLPLDALNMDARIFHAEPRLREKLRRAEADGLLPPLPEHGRADRLSEPIYCVRAMGGFVPPVPKDWKLIQLTSHQTKWAMLRCSDPRLLTLRIQERRAYEYN